MAKTVSAKVGNSVSTLELFFDLVFVFAITQVTAFIAADLTWSGLLKGLLVLALVYWSWIAYSWLGTAVDVDQPAAATYLLTAMGAMFIVAVLILTIIIGPATRRRWSRIFVTIFSSIVITTSIIIIIEIVTSTNSS